MDVRLVEPETARPEEPKQVTIKKNVLLVVVTGATALVIAFMFFGGSSKPETATINEPIVVASTMPELLGNESRNEDSFSLLERGYMIDTTTQSSGAAYPAVPQASSMAGSYAQGSYQGSYQGPSQNAASNPWVSTYPANTNYGGSYGGGYGSQQDMDMEAALKSDPLIFERKEVDRQGEMYNQMELAAAPYRLLRGTVIPAIMITELNSARPGMVLAQVTRDVYDATITHVLIPQGSRLVGSFENIQKADQEHVVLFWSRIVFPDGSTLELPDFEAMETGGQSGLAAKTSRSWGGSLQRLALATVFSLGSLYAVSKVGTDDNLVTSFLVFDLVRRVLDTGEKLLLGNGEPVVKIVVPAGYRFNVYAVADIPINRTW